MNIIDTLGNAFQKGLAIIQKAGEVTHSATDILLDALAGEIKKKGEEKLKEFYSKSRKNLIVSAILNGAMLLCAALTAVFLRGAKEFGLLAAAFINYIILGRAVFNITRFIRAVIIPYRPLIVKLLPVFWAALGKTKSFKAAVQDAIRAAVRFLYNDKVPEEARIAHGVGSSLGLVKSLAEIENKAAYDFYPLVCRFLRAALLYNALLFTVCYGILVFVVKYFVIGTMLNMAFIDLFIFPFLYITGN
jgi:hypothetical protein